MHRVCVRSCSALFRLHSVRLCSVRMENMRDKHLASKLYLLLALSMGENQGPVPERRNNSFPGIKVPYFRDNFIPGINTVPERRNSAIRGINLG